MLVFCVYVGFECLQVSPSNQIPTSRHFFPEKKNLPPKQKCQTPLYTICRFVSANFGGGGGEQQRNSSIHNIITTGTANLCHFMVSKQKNAVLMVISGTRNSLHEAGRSVSMSSYWPLTPSRCRHQLE